MSKHLRLDLDRLERQLLFLAAEVEEACRKSVLAVLQRRRDLVQEVLEGDRAIDRKEVEIEEECLKILALHQPVAADLRFITACLKIDNDLERMGDMAVNIAEHASELVSLMPIAIPPDLEAMTGHATRMVRESLDAFVRSDAKLARKICKDDDEVDRCNRQVIHELQEDMQSNPGIIEQALHLISVSKAVERIADHATNIAEDVVYLVEGDIVRHTLRTHGSRHAEQP